MANNYLLFSSQFSLPEGADPAKVQEWMDEALAEPVDITPEEAATEEAATETEAASRGTWNGAPDSPLAPWRDPDNEDMPSFQAKLDEDGLWLYAEEFGSVPGAVALIQEYWKKFGPPNGKEVGQMGWAETCSKPRLDEFAGGCVAFTRTEEKWFYPSNDACAWVEAHR